MQTLPISSHSLIPQPLAKPLRLLTTQHLQALLGLCWACLPKAPSQPRASVVDQAVTTQRSPLTRRWIPFHPLRLRFSPACRSSGAQSNTRPNVSSSLIIVSTCDTFSSLGVFPCSPCIHFFFFGGSLFMWCHDITCYFDSFSPLFVLKHI